MARHVHWVFSRSGKNTTRDDGRGTRNYISMAGSGSGSWQWRKSDKHFFGELGYKCILSASDGTLVATQSLLTTPRDIKRHS
jgi:hypothetical protein